MYDLEQTGKCVKRLRKNMTLDTVRKIEQGRRGMSIDILIDIADFFNVSTDYLLCRNISDSDINKCLNDLKLKITELINNEMR